MRPNQPAESSKVGSEFETVHTVSDFYDGPRGGIASYKGRPHIYKSMFEDASAGSDVFLLEPIDEETFALAMEDWAIWRRWERAFQKGETTEDTHPALSADRPRHDELEALLEPKLRIDPAKAFRVKGRFEVCGPGEPGLTSTAQLVVCWTPLQNTT
jgi:hypothetical protein